MSKLKDMTNQKFGRLTVISRADNSANGKTMWNCICDCGKKTIVSATNLRTGAVKSCGCMRKETIAKSNYKHGQRRTRLYNIWAKMRYRCEKEYDSAYKYYGGRGIKVCKEWSTSFETFQKWALSNGYSENLTIERIDVNGNYCPQNCKWIELSQQANNRRNNILIEYNGKVQSLMKWCKELNLNYYLIRDRIKKGHMSFEQAISAPLQENKSHRKE